MLYSHYLTINISVTFSISLPNKFYPKDDKAKLLTTGHVVFKKKLKNVNQKRITMGEDQVQ